MFTLRSLPLAVLLATGGASAPALATTYFVDPVLGNDSYSGTQAGVTAGNNQGPWRSVARVNAWLAANAVAPNAIAPGDTVRFKCGGVWDESLVVRRSGLSYNQAIGFSSYGMCQPATAPRLRGSVAVGNWTTVNGVDWFARVNHDALQLVAPQGLLPVARHPNVGSQAAGSPDTLRAAAAVTCASIGASTGTGDAAFGTRSCGLDHADTTALTGADLVGADLVMRDGSYRWDRRRIVSYDPALRRMQWVATGGQLGSNPPVASRPMVYNIEPGWGFFVAGRAWMIDEPGEWAVESRPQADGSTQRTLHVRTLDGAAPPHDPAAPGALRITPRDAAGGGPVGIDISNQRYIWISGLSVTDTAIGVEASNSVNAWIDNLNVRRSALVGVRAAKAQSLVLYRSQVRQSGFTALALDGSVGSLVLGNVVTDTGAHLPPNGDTSPMALTYMAVTGSNVDRLTLRQNLVARSPYIGINVSQLPVSGSLSTVELNTVEASCLYLDDCSAIYTGGRNGLPNQLAIVQNLVLGASGSVIGRPRAANGSVGGSSAQGIYLDDYTREVTATGNVVWDTDNAFQLHLARGNQIRDNKTGASRASDVWFQEERLGNYSQVAGGPPVCADIYNCIVGNVFTGNLSATLPGVTSHNLESSVGDSADFASFDRNRYAPLFGSPIARVRDKPNGVSSTRSLDFAAWQIQTGRDAAGSQLPLRLATAAGTAATLGANQLGNGDFASGVAGWSSWSAAGNHRLSAVADARLGGYASMQASPTGGSLAIANGLAVRKDQRYVVRLAVRAPTQPGSALYAVVRRADNYRNITAGLPIVTTSEWRYVSLIVTATETADGLDGAPRARLDIEVPAGVQVDLDDVFVAPVSPTLADAGSMLRLFAGGRMMSTGTLGPDTFQCPEAQTAQAARCNHYVDIGTGLPIAWPLKLAANTARASVVAAVADPGFADADADGVADVDDLCPATPAGTGVDERGCSHAQRHGS